MAKHISRKIKIPLWFNASVPIAKHQEIDMRTYAKYVLQYGSNEEKRELMGCFRSRIIATKGIVSIE